MRKTSFSWLATGFIFVLASLVLDPALLASESTRRVARVAQVQVAHVTPQEGVPGTRFVFLATGFVPREQVALELRDPNGRTIYTNQVSADDSGRADWTWTAPGSAQAGTYTMKARGQQSNHIYYDISFTITAAPTSTSRPSSTPSFIETPTLTIVAFTATPEPSDNTPTSAPPTATARFFTATPEPSDNIPTSAPAEPTSAPAEPTSAPAEPTSVPPSTSAPPPTSAPQPEPTSAPQPEPTSAPQPEPTSAPQPEPTSAPQPEPTSMSPTDEASAEESVPTATPGAAPTKTVNQAIDEALAELTSNPGKILFNPPQEMTVGETERIEVRLSREITVTQEFTSGLSGPGPPRIEPLPVNRFMQVELTGENFHIIALTDARQVVPSSGSTTWSWDVTPLQHGRQQLNLIVTARIIVAGLEERQNIVVRDEAIDVAVNPIYTAMSIWNQNWQYILTVLLVVSGGITSARVFMRYQHRRFGIASDLPTLYQQLAEAQDNLRLIHARQAEYVLQEDIPLQLIKNERRLVARITKIKEQMSRVARSNQQGLPPDAPAKSPDEQTRPGKAAPSNSQINPDDTTTPDAADAEKSRSSTGKTTIILEETARIREEMRKNADKLLRDLMRKNK